jgi:azurin
MKTILSNTLAIAALVMLCACSKSPETAEQPKAPEKSAPTVADPNLPEKKVEISGNDQMKFDVTLIEAKPAQKITVTLKNIGTMPKISMGHNFVLLAKDLDPAKFVEAGTPHMGREFIAPEMETKVLAHTKLLGPTESDTITFVAPKELGEYTYICSFPGHCAIGMRGVLKVQ